jgi:hypothetical protein
VLFETARFDLYDTSPFTKETDCFARGTEGSNPSPSSGESCANQEVDVGHGEAHDATDEGQTVACAGTSADPPRPGGLRGEGA